MNIAFHMLLGEPDKVLPDFINSKEIGGIVTDFTPMRKPLKWLEDVAKKLPKNVPVCQVCMYSYTVIALDLHGSSIILIAHHPTQLTSHFSLHVSLRNMTNLQARGVTGTCLRKDFNLCDRDGNAHHFIQGCKL